MRADPREPAPAARSLAVSGVSASYPLHDGAGDEALSDVTFSLMGGEVVGLIGPNGSGKSTLVRLLSRQLSPVKGEVTLGDRPLAGFGRFELARQVALVGQEPAVPAGFTVRETVTMGRTPHVGLLGAYTAADEEAVDEALRATGTFELAERRIETLSGGERQRAVFARALAQRPAFLLLDEPTNHLDLRYQVELMSYARAQAAAGTGVLTVLHDLNLAARSCDRLVLLSSGRVVASGPPADVLSPQLLSETYQAAVEVLITPAGLAIVPRFDS